jgi:hypothetical protein
MKYKSTRRFIGNYNTAHSSIGYRTVAFQASEVGSIPTWVTKLFLMTQEEANEWEKQNMEKITGWIAEYNYEAHTKKVIFQMGKETHTIIIEMN